MRHWNIGLIIQLRGALVQKLIPFAQHTQCDINSNEKEKKLPLLLQPPKMEKRLSMEEANVDIIEKCCVYEKEKPMQRLPICTKRILSSWSPRLGFEKKYLIN